MKHALLFLIALFIMTAAVLSARHCPSRPCCADPEKCTKYTAAKAAALDDQILERIHSESGKISYARRTSCPVTGKTSFTNVEYCLRSQKFINASSAECRISRKSQSRCRPPTSVRIQLVSEETGNNFAAQRAACCGANSRSGQNTGNDRSPVTPVRNN